MPTEKQREYSRKYYAANKAKVKERNRRWREANPDARKKQAREGRRRWRAADPERAKLHGWRHRGLPMPTRPRPNACENCGRESWLEVRDLALDHDHATGKFRGWLCHTCNTGLGLLGDNREGLLRALAYLDRTA